jgi:NADH:ubiquinone oxidoreductase subunit
MDKGMIWLARLFSWWHGATLNTRFYTWRHGEFVGQDELGNSYYRTKGGAIHSQLGFQRRWVIYNGISDGSLTPPDWYGWLHHTSDVPPVNERYVKHEWEKPYVPNMTGTPLAYRPPGSTLAAAARPPATGDYEAWSPE